MTNRIILAAALIGLGVIFGSSSLWLPYDRYHDHPQLESKEPDEQRDELLSMQEFLRRDLLSRGEYQCCLEKPCTYCLEKTPKHGEGASCSCLSDIMNGVHPCGECIGEILEGHGNRFISKYFAKSIAEEVGEEHIDTVKAIIASKYNISVEEQL